MPVFILVLNYLLVQMDSGKTSDLDSKPDVYIVLCRTCLHCTDSDSDPCSLSLYRGIGQELESESVSQSVSDNVNEP